MTAREAFLDRVRNAVRDGNRAGHTPPLPTRARVGYQGIPTGIDPAAKFCQELTAAGGFPTVGSPEMVWARLAEILQARSARKILLGVGGLIDRLQIPQRLKPSFEIFRTDPHLPPTREAFFQADIAISNVAHLIAETGTVVMATAPEIPRSLSLLPPVHIALAERSQILPDLFDLFDLFAPRHGVLPSCLSLITGPSKTGDIELKLVTGVHGPGEIHVLIVP